MKGATLIGTGASRILTPGDVNPFGEGGLRIAEGETVSGAFRAVYALQDSELIVSSNDIQDSGGSLLSDAVIRVEQNSTTYGIFNQIQVSGTSSAVVAYQRGNSISGIA